MDGRPAPTPRLRRTWPQRLFIAFNIFLITACLAAASAVGYAWWKFGQIPRFALGGVLDDSDDGPSAPQNFLIVGSDSREGISPDDPNAGAFLAEEVGGQRADTIMILRVDPNRERAALLSIPRDLWVEVAGTGRRSRINSAFLDGPPQLIRTIRDNFGIPIHHYVQIDFVGFQALVSAIDGVPLWFPEPVRDPNTGLLIETPGCHVLDGPTALAFVRSRHYEVFRDDRWRSDPTGDLGRISRQQLFVGRVIRRAIAKGVRDPRTLQRLLNVAIDNVAVDDQLSIDEMLALGRRFRNANPDDIDMFSLPVRNTTIGGAAVLLLLEEEAQPTLDIFRGVEPPAPGELRPADVAVTVLNGSGVAGQAAATAEALRAVGFEVAGTGNAPTAGGPTTVRYPPGSEAAATLVASYLPDAVLEPVPGLEGVELVTGSDFVGILEAPRPRPEAPPAPTTTAPPTTTTTSTTVVGIVPEQPPPEDPAASCG